MNGDYRDLSISFKTLASVLKSNLVDVGRAWLQDSPFPSEMWEIYRGIVNDTLVLFLAHRHQFQGFVYGGHVFEQAYENFVAKCPTDYHNSTKDFKFDIMARELLRICSDYVMPLSKHIAHQQLADYPQLLDVYSCHSFDTISNWTQRLLPCHSTRAYTPVSVYMNVPSPPPPPSPLPPRQIDVQKAFGARSLTGSGYAEGLPSVPLIVSTLAPNRQVTHGQGGSTVSGSSPTPFELDEKMVTAVTSHYQNLLEACTLLVEQGGSVAEYAESVTEVTEILADELRFIFDSIQGRLPREVRYWYDEFRMRDDHAKTAPPELGPNARYDPAVDFYHRLQSVSILPLTDTGIDINIDVENESQLEPDSCATRSSPTPFFPSNSSPAPRSSSSLQASVTCRRFSPSPSRTPDHPSTLSQSTRSSPTLVEADRAGSVWQGVSRLSYQQCQQTSWTLSPAVSDFSVLAVPDSPSPFRPGSTLGDGSHSPKALDKKSARAVASASGSKMVTPAANATSSIRSGSATPHSASTPDDDHRRPQSQDFTLSQNDASRARGTPTTVRHRTGTPGPSVLLRPGTTSRSTNGSPVNSTLCGDTPAGAGASTVTFESGGSGAGNIRIFVPAPSPPSKVRGSAIPIQVGKGEATLSLGRRAGAAGVGACSSAMNPGKEGSGRGNSNIPIHQPVQTPAPRVGESSVGLKVFHESQQVGRSLVTPSDVRVPVQGVISYPYLTVPGVNSSRTGSGGVISTGTATGSSVGINFDNGNTSQTTPPCGGGEEAQTHSRGEDGHGVGDGSRCPSLDLSGGVGGRGRGTMLMGHGHYCHRDDRRGSGEVGVHGLGGSGHRVLSLSRGSRPCGCCCFCHCGDGDSSDDERDPRFVYRGRQPDLFPPVVDFPLGTHSSTVFSGAMSPYGTGSPVSYLFPAKIHPSLLHNLMGYRDLVGLRWDVTQSPGEASFRTKYGIFIPVGLDEDAIVVNEGRKLNVFPGSFKHKIWIEVDSQYAANGTLKWWMDHRWGPIRIEKQTTIKLQDVLSAIRDYFAEPLTLADYQAIVKSKTNVECSNLDRLVAARRERGRRYELMASVMAEDVGYFGNYRRSDVLGTYLTFHGMRTEVRRDGSWVLCLSLGPEA